MSATLVGAATGGLSSLKVGSSLALRLGSVGVKRLSAGIEVAGELAKASTDIKTGEGGNQSVFNGRKQLSSASADLVLFPWSVTHPARGHVSH
jgi:hypothetical protein